MKLIKNYKPEFKFVLQILVLTVVSLIAALFVS